MSITNSALLKKVLEEDILHLLNTYQQDTGLYPVLIDITIIKDVNIKKLETITKIQDVKIDVEKIINNNQNNIRSYNGKFK